MKKLNALRQLQDLEPSQKEFRDSVIAGLTHLPKTLPCKFFYDAEGSRLFDRICELPAYYLTRTEYDLLKDHAQDIAMLAGAKAGVIEFGSGAGVKIRLLLAALSNPTVYVPIDISRVHLIEAAKALAKDFPALPIMPICADYTLPFTIPRLSGEPPRRLLGFFPGSTIGNFTPEEMIEFLRRMARLLGPGSIMIVGVDLPKDKSILETAYDDPQGVTAAFNLNLLQRLNRELHMNFEIDAFRHEARWNADKSRVEMHLVSLGEQSVYLDDYCFDFLPGETIHTENSYKYQVADFTAFARLAGYDALAAWTDTANLFSIHVLAVTHSANVHHP